MSLPKPLREKMPNLRVRLAAQAEVEAAKKAKKVKKSKKVKVVSKGKKKTK